MPMPMPGAPNAPGRDALGDEREELGMRGMPPRRASDDSVANGDAKSSVSEGIDGGFGAPRLVGGGGGPFAAIMEMELAGEPRRGGGMAIARVGMVGVGGVSMPGSLLLAIEEWVLRLE